MKKGTYFIVIIILVFALVTCGNSNTKNDYKAKTAIKIIGGCEYVIAQSWYQVNNIAIVHHGACTNPLHHQENIELKHID